ncbi:hypothetical protein BJ165DRAFT_1401793 [Panaeolus papilionaceus]|nr:hypothetical protein BJ165DRAFT_1401793 [Panaeolus papilionaceus]
MTTEGNSSPTSPNATLIVDRSPLPSLTRSLPNEILQEIFCRCLLPPHQPQEKNIYSLSLQQTPISVPLLLCHVSRLWRELAVSCPALWRRLAVSILNGVARPPVAVVLLWLSRSGGMPLLLSLWQQNDSYENRVATGEVLDVFKQFTNRWHEVQFDLKGQKYCRLFTSDERSAPMLRTFRMSTSFRIHEEDQVLPDILECVPSLTELHVSRIPYLTISGNTPLHIPWCQLETLSLEYVPSVGTSLCLLDRCSKLASATFKIDSFLGPVPFQPLGYGLRSLAVNIGHSELEAFLDHVSLPLLEALSIRIRGSLDRYRWPQFSFQRFLDRSKCCLRHFEVHDSGMESHDFNACLQNSHLQSLIELIVDETQHWTWDAFVTDIAIDLLTSPPFYQRHLGPAPTISRSEENEDGLGRSNISRPRCALPHLESLIFRGRCLSVSDGSLANMVESRWRYWECGGVKRLSRVELELNPRHFENTRRLLEFRREGLQLAVASC